MSDVKVNGLFGTLNIPVSSKKNNRNVSKVNNSNIIHEKKDDEKDKNSSKKEDTKKELTDFVASKKNEKYEVISSLAFITYDKKANLKYMETPHFISTYV